MGHRGGYAYRLCKVQDGKVWMVTEKCFQKGHLKFVGLFFWIILTNNVTFLILHREYNMDL